MDDVGTQTETNPPGVRARLSELTADVQRGFVAEWAVTIILLLFGTTTLVQAFVIPSASMVGTLLIGDHVLVDKLVYAPPGMWGKVLPYREPRRGDIIVFRYPLNISMDYVKRAIGIPGDHIRLVNKQLMLNGHLVNEPYAVHSQPYPDAYRDNFPGERALDAAASAGGGDDREVRGERRAGGAAGIHFRDGRQSRRLRRQPLLGAGAAREHRRDRRWSSTGASRRPRRT